MGTGLSKIVFQPPSSTYTLSSNYFWLWTKEQSKVPAFFINNGSDVTILFSHGNAEDIGSNLLNHFTDFARQLDVNVLAYEYNGYGLSDGTPSEESVYACSEAAFAYLTEVLAIPPSHIICWGRSLGSGPTVHLAERQSKRGRPVRGIILQSGLMSAYRVAFHFRFSMPGDMFCNIDKIENVNSPVLVVHGDRDEVVPFWHGQQMHTAVKPQYRCAPFWVTNAGHNNVEYVLSEGNRYVERLKEFLEEVSIKRDVPPPPAFEDRESLFGCCTSRGAKYSSVGDGSEASIEETKL